MEVCHQNVDHIPLIGATDEKVAPTLGIAAHRPRLECSHRGRAYGHHPIGLLDRQLRPRGDVIPLGVHDVIVEAVHHHRTERVEADSQLDRGDVDAPLAKLGEHLGGEVQTGGGSGRREWSVGVDGLVPLGVVDLFLDVGRKRCEANLVEYVEEWTLAAVKMDESASIAQVLPHLDAQVAGGQLDARGKLLAGPCERLPDLVTTVFEQQYLRGATRWSPHPNAGRQHPRVVDHNKVARLQKVG